MPAKIMIMKNLIFALLAISISLPTFARSGGSHSGGTSYSSGTGAKASHDRVSGYTKKDGTRVATYDRSTRDATKNNNWSTKGNVNPETGKAGTK